MKPLRIGIVGARFAAELHAVNYRPLRGGKVELTAVCARTRGNAEAFAKRHADSSRLRATIRRLVESPDVDVVDMCATTDVHHEIAIAAARAGKHVIVEKPLTGYFGEATRAARSDAGGGARGMPTRSWKRSTAAGVTLCYAEDFVYAPPVAKLRRLLEVERGRAAGAAGRGEPLRVSRRICAPVAHGGRRRAAADGLASRGGRAPPQALGGPAVAAGGPSGRARSWPTWPS